MERFSEEQVSANGRGAVFDEAYYLTGCGLPYFRNDHWLNFFGGIANQIIRSLKPRRVFDAGCAMGMLVESFWDRGVEAYGVDISHYAISHVRPDMRPYCQIGSLVEPLGGTFDLIACIEVVEHMPEAEAQLAIENLTRAADCILFSSTPSDFTEPTHINVHPTIYWLNLFAAQGFWPELLFDAGFVAPHAILFSRRDPRLYQDRELLGAFSEQLRLRAALVEREQRIGGLNADLDRSAARIASLERDLDATAATFNQVRAELADNDARLASLTAEFDTSRQQTLALEADLTIARSRIEEKTAAGARQEAEAARLRALLASEEAAHTEAGEALRLVQAAHQETKIRLAGAEQSLERLVSERDEARVQLEELRESLNRLQVLHDDTSARLTQTQESLAELQAEHVDTSARLAASSRGEEELARQLAAARLSGEELALQAATARLGEEELARQLAAAKLGEEELARQLAAAKLGDRKSVV
jgi:hypothetical protein